MAVLIRQRLRAALSGSSGSRAGFGEVPALDMPRCLDLRDEVEAELCSRRVKQTSVFWAQSVL